VALAAGGVEEVGALALLLGVAGAGLVSLDCPHAARDSAVAPVTASSATRDSRGVDRVAGIGVLSVVGAVSGPTLTTAFTFGVADKCRLVMT
jgi:hypothetical protein